MSIKIVSILFQCLLCVFAIIAWGATVDTNQWTNRAGNSRYEEPIEGFVALLIISWLVSMLVMIPYYFFDLNKKIGLGWVVECVVATIMSVAVFIASIVWAIKFQDQPHKSSNLTSGVVFGFICAVAWLCVIPLAIMNNSKGNSSSEKSNNKHQQTPGLPPSGEHAV